MSERNWQEDWQTYQDKIEAVYAFRRLRRDPYETRIPIFELEEFFEFAREALPYWLQRVRELETQVQDLKERAEAAEEAAIDYARRLDQFHKENEELQERWRELKKSVVAVTATNYNLERAMKQLEAQNRCLKAVAEAAKLVVDEWTLPGSPMMEAPIRLLQEALAALEEGSNDP